MLFRHNENVRRGLGVDVAEGVDVLVLIHLRGRDLPGDDLAEKAVVHNSAPFT